LEEYFDNTKGGYSKVKIGEIYEVVRPTEQTAFNKKIGNNLLLWHGSRVSNFVGILSQGLRIAPPEAPVSGYLFGKGIYLADMAEKSINYCRSYGQDSALILLIEVIVMIYRELLEIPIFYFKVTTTQRKIWRKIKRIRQNVMDRRLHLRTHMLSIRK
jgi:hypothetical protein